MNWTLLVFAGLAAMTFPGAAEETKKAQPMQYETGFGRDEWDPKGWTFVKCPRWAYIGEWVQEDTYIRNRTPDGVSEDQLIADRYFYAYMSMVRDTPYDTAQGLEITARMSFSYDQGPQIVLADQLGANADDYPEYRDHYEFVLYSKGVNVWRHIFRDGQPGWARVAYARFPLQAATIYELKVRIEPVVRSKNGPAAEGRMVTVTVDDQHTFAFHAPEMPNSVFVGITGYASFNRFYHFSVATQSPK